MMTLIYVTCCCPPSLPFHLIFQSLPWLPTAHRTKSLRLSPTLNFYSLLINPLQAPYAQTKPDTKRSCPRVFSQTCPSTCPSTCRAAASQGRPIPVRGNVPGTHGRWSVHNLHSAPWRPGRAGHGRHRTHPAPSKAGFLGSRTMSMLRLVILCRGEQGCTLEDVSMHPWSPLLPVVITEDGYRRRPGSPTRQNRLW